MAVSHLSVLITFFSHGYVKIPGKSNIRKKKLILASSVKVQSIKTSKAWWQQCGAAGHIASAERKETAEMLTLCVFFPYCHTQNPSL